MTITCIDDVDKLILTLFYRLTLLHSA